MKRLAFACLLAVTAGCPGPDTTPTPTTTKSDTNNTQATVTPRGSVVGRVTDAYTGQPMSGVAVKVVASPVLSTTTDDSGVYAIDGLPAGGALTAYFELSGYVRGLCGFTIANTAGNSPQDGANATCNVVLGKADGEVKGNVLLPNGVPASGAIVVADMRPNGFDGVVTTAVAADGTFDLVGLATQARGTNYTVTVNPYDQNGDKVADYGAVSQAVFVTQGTPARTVFTLTNVGQKVIASNVFDGDIDPTDEIQFTFAFPVVTTSNQFAAATEFRLVNTSRANQEVATDITWVSDTQAKVKPQQALEIGAIFRINLNLQNVGGGTFVTNFNFQARPASVTPLTSQVSGLTVTNGPFNFNSNAFSLAWTGVPLATGYLVWAKDTHQNSNYVLVTNIVGECEHCTTNVALPNSFDVNNFDGTQPLSFNNKVTFAVVPTDLYGNFSPLNAAPTAQVMDTVAPTITGYGIVSANSDAINDDAAASTIQIRVFFNEPMDTATPPTFITAASVGATWTWEVGGLINNQGSFTLTIQPGADATGPYSIRGGKDSSGNAVVQGEITDALHGRKELLSNPGFETGNCSVTNWIVAHTGSATDPVANSSSVRSGACAAVLGFPAGTVPQTGEAKLYQDVALPAIPPNANWTFQVGLSYRTFAQAVSGMTLPFTVTQQCRLVDQTETTTIATLANAISQNSPFTFTVSPTQTILSAYANTTVRLLCSVNNTGTQPANVGLYVDDVSVALVK